VSNPEAREELLPTPAGIARLDWFPASGQPRAVALLGHGTATGVEAADLQALAVLALAYPLPGPGSPRELLATGRPTLIIQGGSDPFGRPGQFPPLPPQYELIEMGWSGRSRWGSGRSAS
jgi:hypothetical protein